MKGWLKVCLWVGLVVWALSVVLLCFFCLYDPSANPGAGERIARPVIEALERYRGTHGHYPDKLDQLVAEGLLGSIPTVPDNGNGVMLVQQKFGYDPGLGLYRLYFYYDPLSFFMADSQCHAYLSDLRRWQRGYLSMGEVVADRSARRFRTTGSSRDLKRYFEAILKEAHFDGGTFSGHLWKRTIDEALGQGEKAELDGEPGRLYRASDGGCSYLVVYEFAPLTGGHDALGKVYVSEQGDRGGWKLAARSR